LIRSLPIPKIDDVFLQKMTFLYNDLITDIDNLNKLKYNFVKIICSDFEITQPSVKIQKWYELNWNNFVLEIKKLKGSINKQKQLEWVDFFIENQHKYINLNNDKNSKTNSINELVYALYNLTNDEIALLEE